MRLGGQSQAERARDLASASRVDVVIMLIGHNDINLNFTLMSRIAAGSMSSSNHQPIDAISSNVAAAWQTIKAGNTSSVSRLMVVEMADLMQTPDFIRNFGTPTGSATSPAARVRKEVDRVNQSLRNPGMREHATFVDFPRFQDHPNGLPTLQIGGVILTRLQQSHSNPTYVFLDGIHPRAVGNLLIANMILQGLNSRLNKNVAMVTDRKILLSAGIGDQFQNVTLVGRFNFRRYVTQY